MLSKCSLDNTLQKKNMAYNPPLGANSLVAHGLSLYLNVHSVEIAVRSKSVVLLLLTNCFVYLPLFVGVLCWSLFGIPYFLSIVLQSS